MSSEQKVRKEQLRVKRHRSVRKKVVGTGERPRLVVHRSNKSIQAHIVDDSAGKTLIGICSLSGKVAEKAGGKLSKTEMSKVTGQVLAELARAKGIEKVVFDRGGHLYHGRVKALADGAREGGLAF
jgi:large subunit ribosomal protein L18